MKEETDVTVNSSGNFIAWSLFAATKQGATAGFLPRSPHFAVTAAASLARSWVGAD